MLTKAGNLMLTAQQDIENKENPCEGCFFTPSFACPKRGAELACVERIEHPTETFIVNHYIWTIAHGEEDAN